MGDRSLTHPVLKGEQSPEGRVRLAVCHPMSVKVGNMLGQHTEGSLVPVRGRVLRCLSTPVDPQTLEGSSMIHSHRVIS